MLGVSEMAVQEEYLFEKYQGMCEGRRSVAAIPVPNRYLRQRVDVSCVQEPLLVTATDWQRGRIHAMSEVYASISVWISR